MEVQITATCDGSGFWSNSPDHAVQIDYMDLGYIDKERCYGELRAYFTKENWDIFFRGFIYTDGRWMTEFRAGLVQHGFTEEEAADVDYSEQGMQGDDFVSMDFGAKFFQGWCRVNNIVKETA